MSEGEGARVSCVFDEIRSDPRETAIGNLRGDLEKEHEKGPVPF